MIRKISSLFVALVIFSSTVYANFINFGNVSKLIASRSYYISQKTHLSTLPEKMEIAKINRAEAACGVALFSTFVAGTEAMSASYLKSRKNTDVSFLEYIAVNPVFDEQSLIDSPFAAGVDSLFPMQFMYNKARAFFKSADVNGPYTGVD